MYAAYFSNAVSSYLQCYIRAKFCRPPTRPYGGRSAIVSPGAVRREGYHISTIINSAVCLFSSLTGSKLVGNEFKLHLPLFKIRILQKNNSTIQNTNTRLSLRNISALAARFLGDGLALGPR